MSDVEFEPVNIHNLTHIWESMRTRDRQELALQGMTDETYISVILNLEFVACAKYKGEPVAIIGYGKNANIWLVFFGTPALDQHQLLFIKTGKQFVDCVVEKEFPARILVEVWSEHKDSLRWLSLLGFKNTAYLPRRRGEQFLVMEYAK